MIAFLGAVFATGLVMAAVFAYLVTRPRLSVLVEDSTPDEDEMDAYLRQRAEGKGVLPPEAPKPERSLAAIAAKPKIHPKCFDLHYDGYSDEVCPDCAPLLEGVKPVVTRG